MKIPATMNGQRVELELDEEALAQIGAGVTPREPVPIEGYHALKNALAAVGINKAVSTLKEWKGNGKLPYRIFNGRIKFYLPEVLDRIGGKAT